MSLTVDTLRSVSYRHAVVLSYRHLYRTALRTVRYTKPERVNVRNILRSAFRSGSSEDFSPQRIINTIRFIDRGKQPGTTERKILKNLTRVNFYRGPSMVWNPPFFSKKRTNADYKFRSIPYVHFDNALHLLNESLELCLRC
ncbi:hypothetical protein D8B26_006856 [Coccidioides posadasii str. Silveira]|uniref:Uncharacterized protein n=3 Tax=Coccidioides posadasii TaxID=199306 RepID=E9CS45_COCPS|nr:hypothetical protein CPC735_035180 [Coccidioides posadasii C735 delta SOWgp]EER28182.1 hypothetical protein CPC735_035180 [Coccidioides posadasii C735 delta SOWgp]EFW23366.1 conserved hypothetical protein [Coccidioides posadasii str. Silveira]KMM68232.1 hypothetical protein CPAG_04563 [Coccidioides posadasii RMSCC 3488]QVM12222.1 hypothetical protein D8B26_006856 [Coccidioides posadasii str. Silveira]|eukprot:XP_003070327.1 hypothetical protein CPC735_035180 [Coccidioides posadasii C735 delta SOWgp]